MNSSYFQLQEDNTSFSGVEYYHFDTPSYENNMLDFEMSPKIENIKQSNDIPANIYIGQSANENTAENKSSDLNDSDIERCSVEGEKKYGNKSLSTDESSSPCSTSYEPLFYLVEDKDQYEIGSSEDELCIDDNSQIKNINCIVANDSTDLNDFIGDMLKFCPSDNLVKKQRIYKAKNIKRKRKSRSQVKKLEREFLANNSWTKEDFKRLSETLGLSRDQVYKWYWDQKNKKF